MKEVQIFWNEIQAGWNRFQAHRNEIQIKRASIPSPNRAFSMTYADPSRGFFSWKPHFRLRFRFLRLLMQGRKGWRLFMIADAFCAVSPDLSAAEPL